MAIKHSSQTVRDWLGYLTQTEIDRLRVTVAELPQGAQVVNLGAGGGTSGLVFMEAPTNLRVTTVDRQKESDPRGCLEGEEVVFRSAGFWGQARHRQIHADSTAAALAWDGGGIDLLFHDADHTYDKVKLDLEAWLPHLKPQALILLHDYEDRIHQGVAPAANEVLSDCELLWVVGTLACFRLP